MTIFCGLAAAAGAFRLLHLLHLRKLRAGLVDRVDVSQYRLATHLTLACLIFAYLFGLARYLAFAPVRRDAAARPHPLSLLAALLVAAVFIQIFLGGLVAGLKAGHSFNTWPLMDGALVPSGLWMMSPVWLNHFESVLTVQFQHRIAAYVVVALAVAVFWVIARRADTRHLRGAALAGT